MFSSITLESWKQIRRQAPSTITASVDRHDQPSGPDPVDIGIGGSAEKPSWSNSLQHFRPGLRSLGLGGCLLCYKSCTPLLCVVATLSAAQQRCSGARDGAALGADGVDEQPGSGAGNASRQVYR